MNAAEIKRYLTGISLFEHADERTLDELSSSVQTINMPANHVLFQQGDLVTDMYAVVKGRLKIYMLSCSGKQRVVRLVGEGDSFGEVMVINDTPSPVYAESLTRCELLVLPKQQMDQLLSQRLDISRGMVKGLSRIAQELLADLQACCLQNAVQRIAQYLCTLSNLCEDKQSFSLPASKATVASLLNLTPESFSRGLNQLSSAGYITINKKRITVFDPDKLKSVSAGNVDIAA